MSFKKDARFDPVYSSNGSKSVIYKENMTGQQRIVTTKDLSPITKHCEASQLRAGSKRSNFFAGRHETVIARVDILEMLDHPEWDEGEDGAKEFYKWIDAHPERKILPVGWTRVQNTRNSHTDLQRKSYDRIFGNG